MDFTFIRQYAPVYALAAKLTLEIALIGILISMLVGIVCTMILHYRIPVLKRVVGIYIELSRNTPLLIQLFFLYFGLPKLGIMIDSEQCAILGLSFLGGSYMAEAFRSGLEAVEQIQWESSAAIGLSSAQALRCVIFPQALASAVPAVCANVIFLIKETSVFSAVALADLMFVAKDLIGLYYKTDEALFMLVIAYLVILLPISAIFAILERKLRYAGFGN